MSPSFTTLECEISGCGFVTVDESELEDHKQFHEVEHIHSWAWKHSHHQWVCECGMMTDFFCIYCNVAIPRKEIPKKALTKIGMQVYFHNDCMNEGLKQ